MTFDITRQLNLNDTEGVVGQGRTSSDVFHLWMSIMLEPRGKATTLVHARKITLIIVDIIFLCNASSFSFIRSHPRNWNGV